MEQTKIDCFVKLERLKKIRIACSGSLSTDNHDKNPKLQCNLIQTNINSFTLTEKRKRALYEDNHSEGFMETFLISAGLYILKQTYTLLCIHVIV